MEKRICSRAIIIENDSIITMFRRKIKDGMTKEYYAIPGGGLEPGETLEENIIREIKEELNLDIEIIEYLGQVEDDNAITHFFNCKRRSGELKIGGPEIDRNSTNNYYEIKYLKLSDIHKVDIFFTDMIEKVMNNINN